MLWPAGAGGAPSRSRARAPVEGRGSLPRTPTTPSIRVLGVGAEARGAASRGAGVLDSLPGAVRWAGSLCDSPPSCAPAVRLWGAVGSGLGLGPHADRWGCAVFLPPPPGGVSLRELGDWKQVRRPRVGARSVLPGALAQLRPGQAGLPGEGPFSELGACRPGGDEDPGPCPASSERVWAPGWEGEPRRCVVALSSGPARR